MAEDSYDVFLSHSHAVAAWVEKIAEKLADEENLAVWLDQWVVVAGRWQPQLAKGLQTSKSCAVFLNPETPGGWFGMEIDAALDIHASRNPDYRVIPVMMPGFDPKDMPLFLGNFDRMDFRNEQDFDCAFYRLACAVRGVAPGRWKPKPKNPEAR